MANSVTLTFAGDSADAEKAFDRVGAASEKMDRQVRDSADSFDRVGEAADNVDTRAMGFRDTLTGLQDGFAGIKAVNDQGLGLESLLLLGFGVGDLASGMFNFLVPAAKAAAGAIKGLNLAFLSSPITWVILAIVALIAIFVVLWTKCDWFRNFWKGLWAGIKSTAGAVGSWFAGPFVRFFQSAWDKITALPGKIRDVFAKIGGWLFAPFRTAFNQIARAWNATIGRLSWTVPGWVPGVGGNSIGAPKLPTFHSGGVVPGAPGQEMLAVLQAGETVTPAGRTPATVIEVRSGGSRLDDLLVELLRRAIRGAGGNVQLVLGSGRV